MPSNGIGRLVGLNPLRGFEFEGCHPMELEGWDAIQWNWTASWAKPAARVRVIGWAVDFRLRVIRLEQRLQWNWIARDAIQWNWTAGDAIQWNWTVS